jgi:integrase/recombinase XerD
MKTGAGFKYFLESHAVAVVSRAPTLATKSIPPNVLRHSGTMHMLQSTREVRKVALWLDHAILQSIEI